MNRQLYFLFILLAAIVSGCSKADELLYHDIDRLNLYDTTTVGHTFFYEPATVLQDTVYIQVNTIGQTTNYDRPVKFVQLTDTATLHPAVPGVHYVAFDDPSISKLMVVKANAVTAMIPVVLLRDPALSEASYRLKFQLAANDQFGLGEEKSRVKSLVFSDRLERFYSWRVDGTQAPAFINFGKYSIAKHQFMVDQLKEQIDEEWYQASVAADAREHYKNVLKQALVTFNSDPVNIASGKAPLRETDNPSSPLVVFP